MRRDDVLWCHKVREIKGGTAGEAFVVQCFLWERGASVSVNFDLFDFGCLLYAQIRCKTRREGKRVSSNQNILFLTSCDASYLTEIWQNYRNKERFLQLSFRKSDLFALPVHTIFKMDSNCALWTTFAILALVQPVVSRLLTIGGGGGSVILNIKVASGLDQFCFAAATSPTCMCDEHTRNVLSVYPNQRERSAFHLCLDSYADHSWNMRVNLNSRYLTSICSMSPSPPPEELRICVYHLPVELDTGGLILINYRFFEDCIKTQAIHE